MVRKLAFCNFVPYLRASVSITVRYNFQSSLTVIEDYGYITQVKKVRNRLPRSWFFWVKLGNNSQNVNTSCLNFLSGRQCASRINMFSRRFTSFPIEWYIFYVNNFRLPDKGHMAWKFVTLISGSVVSQRHWKWFRYVDLVCYYWCSVVSLPLKRTVFDIFDFEL